MDNRVNSKDRHDIGLYEYSNDEFLSVMEQYKKSKYEIPMIQSVIEGKLKGRIFSDRKDNPRTIVIITDFNWLCVLGEQESEVFKIKFCDFLQSELSKNCDHFAWFYLSEYWQHKLTEMFGSNIKSFPRIKYELNKEKYEMTKDFNLPEEYKILQIDSKLVDKASELFDGLKMFWSTNENFLKNSFGFCILYEDEIVSACQALAITENISEIDVFTKDGFRGKSLAYFTCAAFIEHCLKLGLKPYWETVRANKSSCRLAEKLGFKEVREFPFYAWFK